MSHVCRRTSARGGISTLLERIRVKYKVIQLTGNQPSSFKSLPFLQRAVKWHAQVCEEISLCSQTIFFPQWEQRDTKTAKPQEDVWHFHDLSKDDSVATIPEENTYIKIEYITQKIALCATGLKKKIYTSAGLQYVICA